MAIVAKQGDVICNIAWQQLAFSESPMRFFSKPYFASSSVLSYDRAHGEETIIYRIFRIFVFIFLVTGTQARILVIDNCYIAREVITWQFAQVITSRAV